MQLPGGGGGSVPHPSCFATMHHTSLMRQLFLRLLYSRDEKKCQLTFDRLLWYEHNFYMTSLDIPQKEISTYVFSAKRWCRCHESCLSTTSRFTVIMIDKPCKRRISSNALRSKLQERKTRFSWEGL